MVSETFMTVDVGAHSVRVMTSSPRLNAISIVCDNLSISLDFYRLLGLDIPETPADAPHVEVDLGGFRVLFDPVSTIMSFDPEWTRSAPGSSAMSLAFECSTPAEVDAVAAKAAERGGEVARAPFDAPWGQRYATVRDPDGNEVDLYAGL